MPLISVFLGIVIRIYHDDHNPPHFHAYYGEFAAIIEIGTGRVIGGKLPARVLRLVNEWRKLRNKELKNAWKLACMGEMPGRIKPLE